MPKDRKRVVDSDDSDSGPDDRNSAPSSSKKARTGQTQKVVVTPGGMKMEDGEPTWELGKMKRVKVREFRGKTYIDIREWYVDNKTMETKPGKKGISLTPEQYQTLKMAMPEIDSKLP